MVSRTSRKLRMGMVGGGEGAFIGAVHRMAAAMDGQIELVCGAFSGQPEVSRRSGEELFLPAARVYDDYSEMMAAEAALAENLRMDFVSIVTPNHLHLPVALSALEHGFHVMSEKPATFSLAEALTLRDKLSGCDRIYGLAHTYNGYPMVKEARERVLAGELGRIRKIVVEYSQGWLADREEERPENRQAAWRLDPSRSGVSCCIGDIGVHAFNLAEYITGLRVTELCADLGHVVPGRILDDDASVLLRFENEARGVLIASQISVGDENDLRIRVYGDLGALDWTQGDANSLFLKSNQQPERRLRTAGPGTSELSRAHTRTPAGHPEGYLEAFANLYRQFAEQLRGKLEMREPAPWSRDLAGIDEAIRGLAFIEETVAASESSVKWHALRTLDRLFDEDRN
ncbi:MAG: Gfo/Idh/MocA family oxidoreductase [Myxococcota bacterium]